MPTNRAAGYVLKCITAAVAAGTPAISYEYIRQKTNYSLPTICAATRLLETQHFIRVERGGPRRANRYILLTEEQRRIRAVAQFIGLIQ